MTYYSLSGLMGLWYLPVYTGAPNMTDQNIHGVRLAYTPASNGQNFFEGCAAANVSSVDSLLHHRCNSVSKFLPILVDERTLRSTLAEAVDIIAGFSPMNDAWRVELEIRNGSSSPGARPSPSASRKAPAASGGGSRAANATSSKGAAASVSGTSSASRKAASVSPTRSSSGKATDSPSPSAAPQAAAAGAGDGNDSAGAGGGGDAGAGEGPSAAEGGDAGEGERDGDAAQDARGRQEGEAEL